MKSAPFRGCDEYWFAPMFTIGIDGGGTSTKAVLVDRQGTVLGCGHGGPSSVDTVSAETTSSSVLQAVEQAYDAAGIARDQAPFGIVAGLGGVVSDRDKEGVKRIIQSHFYATERLEVCNDMVIALAGGCSCRPGVVMIMGTGAVAYGDNQDEQASKQTHKCGGWGWKEGDPGSAYDLGVQAIRAVVRAYDGRAEGTAFTAAVFERLRLTCIADITTVLYQDDMQRTEIAQLAQLVTEFFERDDPTAADIVRRCFAEVHEQISAVRKVVFGGRRTEVALCGGLTQLGGKFGAELRRVLADLGDVHGMETSSQVGAAMRAWKM